MAPTYKLLALDVDGTILNHRHQIAPETRAAVRRAMERGMFVTLATGRAFPSARMIARELGLRTPLVTHDGAYVADPITMKVLYEERIPTGIVRQAVALLQPLGLHISLLHEHYAVCNQRIRSFQWEFLKPAYWPMLGNILQENRAYPSRYARDLLAYLHDHPLSPPKLWATGRPEAIAEARRLMQERLGAILRCPPSGPNGMEIMLVQTSKAAGLRRLAAALGIDFSQVIAVGDSHNDVEMITQAGLGVAMGNAPEDVRSLAAYVTRTNAEHGVAHVVERFILGESA